MLMDNFPPAAEITPEDFLRQAREAYNLRHTGEVAAFASMAAVGMIQEFLKIARDGVEHQWLHVNQATGGVLACVCGIEVFTGYPNTQELPWLMCATPECSAVYEMTGDGRAVLRRGAVRAEMPDRGEPPWQKNDLVRYRDGQLEYVALLQAKRYEAGWWDAMVMRSTNMPLIVGQGIQVQEGSPSLRVARFPD